MAEQTRDQAGSVWLARDRRTGSVVRLRLLPLTTRERDIDRFLHDVPLLTGLRHPALRSCLQGGLTAASTPYLVWEHAEGPDLAAWIERHGRLAPAMALALVRELAGGLEAALERGLHHGAVRAERVAIDPGQGPAHGALTDLGTPRLHAHGGPGGENRAPEEFDDPESVDYRADIYGLGCILYHCLVGHAPFTGRSAKGMVRAKITGEIPQAVQAKADVPLAVNDLITDLMDPRQDHRPQSYREVRERCTRLLGGAAKPLGRHGNRAASLGVAALVAILGGTAWLLVPQQPPPPAPAPVAGPATDTPVTDEVVWQTPRPLLIPDPALRLAPWLADGGATAWQADPARRDGILARSGRIHRPVEGLPFRLRARVLLTEGAGTVALGVQTADERSVAIEIVHVGALVHAAVEPPLAGEPVSLPADRPVEVTIEVRADGFLAIVAGNRFDALPLTAAPRDLFIAVSGDGIAVISALGLQERR